MRTIPLILFLAAASLVQTGCVVGRRTVDLPVPSQMSTQSGKGSLRVMDVTDSRTFENKPRDPSTPSIDGDVNSMTDAQKSIMIGRQRNGYGHAMGDIALPANRSVQERTRVLIENGLKKRGYVISDDPASANYAKVEIREFWAWFTPGMWVISFEARLDCVVIITVDGKAHKLEVAGYAKNVGQVASDANWQKAYRLAFENFLTNLDDELQKEGL
jgi:hypothetical protein